VYEKFTCFIFLVATIPLTLIAQTGPSQTTKQGQNFTYRNQDGRILTRPEIAAMQKSRMYMPAIRRDKNNRIYILLQKLQAPMPKPPGPPIVVRPGKPATS